MVSPPPPEPGVVWPFAPGATWGWRFEGHHLSLSFTVTSDGHISGTPSMMGAQQTGLGYSFRYGKVTGDDARVRALPGQTIRHDVRVHVHIGSAEVQGRVRVTTRELGRLAEPTTTFVRDRVGPDDEEIA